MEPLPPVPSPTGGEGSPVEEMKPASTSPMKKDEQSDARGDRELELHGHRVEDQPAQPGHRQSMMITPLITTRPIASGQLRVPTTVVARNELMPRPAAKANGNRANTPNRIVITPAANDVVADTCAKFSLGRTRRGGRQDDRVQHDDVGHRDEGDQAAPNLGPTVEPRAEISKEPIEQIHARNLRVAGTIPPAVGRCPARRQAVLPPECAFANSSTTDRWSVHMARDAAATTTAASYGAKPLFCSLDSAVSTGSPSLRS